MADLPRLMASSKIRPVNKIRCCTIYLDIEEYRPANLYNIHELRIMDMFILLLHLVLSVRPFKRLVSDVNYRYLLICLKQV